MKWDVLVADASNHEALHRAGHAGWELVSVSELKAYFKRPYVAQPAWTNRVEAKYGSTIKKGHEDVTVKVKVK